MSRTHKVNNRLVGIFGVLLVVTVLLAAVNFNKLPLVRNTNTIDVHFPEAAGLESGADVRVSGATVGTVTDVHLEGATVVATVALGDDAPDLGSRTSASIITVTLLGTMAVELTPAGEGDLAPGSAIPVSRTSAPFDLNNTLNRLTDESTSIDKQQLSQSLDKVAQTFSGTPGHVNQALEGVQQLSTAIAENDAQLQSLLGRAKNVSGVLATHNERISHLFTAGRALLAELDARQQIIEDLLQSAQDLSQQLRAVIDENAEVVGPALSRLNELVDLLNENKQNLQQTITGVRDYATAFNEAISTGPFFDAYIQNLTSPGTVAPVLSGALQ